MEKAVKHLTGMEFILPTHQGRAAERIIYGYLGGKGKTFISNTHFDTTRANIEFSGAEAIDIVIDEANEPALIHPFKGNMNTEKLEKLILEKGAENIGAVILTVTNNSGGGQPVSMKNTKEVSAICKKHHVMLLLDCCRVAENAYFIKQREAGYQEKSIREIVLEMFSYGDGMTMSSKKDAIVNMGGFIALRDQGLFREASTFNIMFEGFITYGGMSGRDMNALAQGLYEGTEFDTLDTRIKQVAYLGGILKDASVPLQLPFGGHAIFVDAKRFLPQLPKEQFAAQTLAVELYMEGGVRGVEIGTILADRDPVSRENRYPELELLRLAIPRRTYTNNHMAYVAAALINVWERRHEITSGYKITYEAPIMRHFTVELEKV